MTQPLMPKATAVWLIDNTALTFEQIAAFCELHALEVQAIADGEVSAGIQGFDPVLNGQLTKAEIERCEKDPKTKLAMAKSTLPKPVERTKGPKYVPVAKRGDKPDAIAWLLKHHEELKDSQIAKLVGTTKPTIQSIRERTHWNIQQMEPIDPVALGLCKQSELDAAVQKAAKKKAAEGDAMSDDDRRKLLSTEQSLGMEAEPKMPTAIEGLETFTLSGNDDDDEDEKRNAPVDADSFFNLPDSDDEDDNDDN